MICVLLAVAGRTLADNLSVEDLTLQAGETRQIGIVMNNPDTAYAAFQFDLVLPAGVTIATNDKGKFVASLNADRVDDHTLNVSKKGEGTYRFMSFSMSNTAFSGTSGVLVYVTLTADDSFLQSGTGTVTSQVFTEPGGTQHKWKDVTFTIGEVANKCAMPTIVYNQGKLRFDCATPGARFVSRITSGDAMENEGQEVQLSAKYTVTVYAVADGYADSDPVTATITWGDGTMTVENITVEATIDKRGDVNRDNKVDVADIASVLSVMAELSRRLKIED